MTNVISKSSRDNRANQLNPTHTAVRVEYSTEDAHVQAEQHRFILNNHENRPNHGRNDNGGAR